MILQLTETNYITYPQVLQYQLTAEQQGAKARANLVELRLKKEDVDFFEPIKRMNFKTMANVKKRLNLHRLKAISSNTSTRETLSLSF